MGPTNIPPLSRALVLNVEDHDAKRHFNSRILQQAGFEVVDAPDIASARAAIAQRAPDLVVLDVRLPDGDGRDLCAWIKSSPDTSRIVVLQTSVWHVESKDRVASLDAGADGYLIEPIEPAELVAKVRSLLRLRQAESERQAALEALREADRRKDEFLAMLAHELRNPLAPIRNAVEVLKSGDDSVRERARAIIGRQVTHLARLVDDLLEVSRITQRKVILKKTRVTVGAILEAAIETAQPFFEAEGQKLLVRARDGGLTLDADVLRLSQAIGNLLHNASRFSPRGSTIVLETEADDAGLEIRVRDAGTGIASEVLPHVFELFIQDERSPARSPGGLGVGLSLVHGMVSMHGGTVTAKSEGRDRGSVFTVRLPLPERVAPATRSPRSVDMTSAASRRILVVEDNQDAAEALCMVLESYGHEVTVANDGASAIEAAREGAPDVVLLDIGLPGMDGYELAGRLRALRETEFACLIAVTGYGQQKDNERSARSDFDLHLTKPVEPQQLSDAILRGSRKRRRPGAFAGRPPAGAAL